MKKGRRTYSLLFGYITREYFLSFLVSFLFFFFIFFVNQILVLAKEILLKNVSIKIVLYLVVLSIPQFLLYTFPFSSLTGASMVIGDLSSKNEILAIRFSGINIKHVFTPIIMLSLLFSFSSILISNNLIPYTAEKYKEQYSKILSDLPTIEIESYKINNINDLVLANGRVDGSTINDLTIFDSKATDDANAITSNQGNIKLIDLNRYLYELTLSDPRVLTTQQNSINDWGLANASEMKIYLNFSNLIPTVQSITPSQMSLFQLQEKALEKMAELNDTERNLNATNAQIVQKLADDLNSIKSNSDDKLSALEMQNLKDNADLLLGKRPVSFYLQYYRSEFNKKLALSMACTFLVFIAFPISFFKVRYGRLIGFAISVFVSVAYWFFIFFMQLNAVEVSFNPAILMWTPNLVFFLIGMILIWRLSKN